MTLKKTDLVPQILFQIKHALTATNLDKFISISGPLY